MANGFPKEVQDFNAKDHEHQRLRTTGAVTNRSEVRKKPTIRGKNNWDCLKPALTLALIDLPSLFSLLNLLNGGVGPLSALVSTLRTALELRLLSRAETSSRTERKFGRSPPVH